MIKIYLIIFGILIISALFLIIYQINKNPQNKEMDPQIQNQSQSQPQKENDEISITTIYDNYQFDSDLKTGWGFSALLKINGKNILFDTGADSPTLLSNMEKLNIDPKEIDSLFLSHIHGDHVDGLTGFLEENSKITVYLPASFPSSFKTSITEKGAKIVEIKESQKISAGIYSTGELGSYIKEQSLVVDSDKGLVIITGCAHPGIVDIIKFTKDQFKKDIYLVLGGFHLSAASDSQLRDIIRDFKNLGVEKVAPCHCSGNRCRELFENQYQNNYIENGVGKIINI